MYTYINTHIHTYTHTHTHIHTYIHSYIHTYIYTYIHTYIHSFIHSYIHTHTYPVSRYALMVKVMWVPGVAWLNPMIKSIHSIIQSSPSAENVGKHKGN